MRLLSYENHLLCTSILQHFMLQAQMRSIFSVLSYSRPAKLRKFQGPNYQRKFAGGLKIFFISMWRFLCCREEILKRQLLLRGQEFAKFPAIEKALAGLKKNFRGPYVVQACPLP